MPRALLLVCILLAMAVCLALAIILLKQAVRRTAGKAQTDALPYRKNEYFLSKAELSFYFVLLQAIGERWRVFAKVRLLDLVWLPRGTANAQAHRNRVQSKHVDFLICTPDNIAPALVIELDDASHEREDRQARDTFINDALRAAGIPVLHVPASRSYVVADLARQVESLARGIPSTEA